MNGKAGAVFTVMVACLALEAIMKDQIEQLNKIGTAVTGIGSDEEAGKNRKVRVLIRFVTFVHLTFCFRPDLSLSRV